jgi:hypothetical protein
MQWAKIRTLIATTRPARDCTVEWVNLMAGIKKLFGDNAYGSDPFRKPARRHSHL